MDFKEDKTTISELRALIGKGCSQRTLRGWISAGTIVAIELRDEIYLVVENSTRGSREQHIRLDKCKIDEIKDTPQKPVSQSKRIADKIKKVEEAKKRQDVVSDMQPLDLEEHWDI